MKCKQLLKWISKNRFVTYLFTLVLFCGCATHEKLPREPKYFHGKRLVHNNTLTYDYSVEEVFPLLCPVREYEWMSTWKGTIVFTESGLAEKYVVFYHKLPFPLSKKVYWTATQYEENKIIQWTVFAPNIGIIVIDQHFTSTSDNKARINYTYTVTSLSKQGNKLMSKLFSSETIDKEQERTLDEINHYLKTGKMLETKIKSNVFN